MSSRPASRNAPRTAAPDGAPAGAAPAAAPAEAPEHSPEHSPVHPPVHSPVRSPVHPYTWRIFFKKFGGGLRSKHTRPAEGARLRKQPGHRPYALPAPKALPAEFIRLCPWEAEYLFAVARRARVGILETGRFNGGSLFLMACAAPRGAAQAIIDIAPRDDARLERLLARHCPEAEVQLVTGDSHRPDSHRPDPHRPDPRLAAPVDLLFIDGDHSYEGCLADLETWSPRLVPGGHVVLHDAYLGDYGVQDAIHDFLAARPEFTALLPPFIGASHWNYPAGSLAHLVRRPDPAGAKTI